MRDTPWTPEEARKANQGDLIHILKIFNWENDELICIGG